MEIIGPDGEALGQYELRTGELPKERGDMPSKPRWRSGINAAYYEEDYSTLWRRREHFLDGAIHRYRELLKTQPKSARLMLCLARAYIKDAQVRIGSGYRKPGPQAEVDAAKRRQSDLAEAVKLLAEVLKLEPGSARAFLYLGLARERQGNLAAAEKAWRAALKCDVPAWPAAMHLARCLLARDPKEAVALARRAAEVYPQSSRAGHVLIACLIAAGKAEEAEAVGRRLAQADPADGVAARLLARAAGKAGRSRQSQTYEEEARRLVGGDGEAAKALEADLRWLQGD